MLQSISRACNLPIEIVMKEKKFYCHKAEQFSGPSSRLNNCFDNRNSNSNEVSGNIDSENVDNEEDIGGNIGNNETNTNNNNVSGISLTDIGENYGNIGNNDSITDTQNLSMSFRPIRFI